MGPEGLRKEERRGAVGYRSRAGECWRSGLRPLLICSRQSPNGALKPEISEIGTDGMTTTANGATTNLARFQDSGR